LLGEGGVKTTKNKILAPLLCIFHIYIASKMGGVFSIL
jgi:hypothetical protein